MRVPDESMYASKLIQFNNVKAYLTIKKHTPKKLNKTWCLMNYALRMPANMQRVTTVHIKLKNIASSSKYPLGS